MRKASYGGAFLGRDGSMQETALPPNPGFVVEWQLSDGEQVIDLSTAESEVILTEDADELLRLT
jgi:hypothetical protein